MLIESIIVFSAIVQQVADCAIICSHILLSVLTRISQHMENLKLL